MKKSVEIDRKTFEVEDPVYCWFNYDCLACKYPDEGVHIQCPDWEKKEAFPEKCPLKEVKHDKVKVIFLVDTVKEKH